MRTHNFFLGRQSKRLERPWQVLARARPDQRREVGGLFAPVAELRKAAKQVAEPRPAVRGS